MSYNYDSQRNVGNAISNSFLRPCAKWHLFWLPKLECWGSVNPSAAPKRARWFEFLVKGQLLTIGKKHLKRNNCGVLFCFNPGFFILRESEASWQWASTWLVLTVTQNRTMYRLGVLNHFNGSSNNTACLYGKSKSSQILPVSCLPPGVQEAGFRCLMGDSKLPGA